MVNTYEKRFRHYSFLVRNINDGEQGLQSRIRSICLNHDFIKIFRITKIIYPANLVNLMKILVQDNFVIVVSKWRKLEHFYGTKDSTKFWCSRSPMFPMKPLQRFLGVIFIFAESEECSAASTHLSDKTTCRQKLLLDFAKPMP